MSKLIFMSAMSESEAKSQEKYTKLSLERWNLGHHSVMLRYYNQQSRGFGRVFGIILSYLCVWKSLCHAH